MPPLRPSEALEEFGSSGLKRYGGFIFEEYLRELRGPRGMRTFREMKDNDPVIGAMLFAFEYLARQVDWRIEPADESNEAKQEAELISGALFDDMEQHWNDTLSEIFSMLWAGWAWLEIVFKRRGGDVVDPKRKSRFTDGKIGWRKWALRGQETLYEWRFSKDSPDDVVAMIQQTVESARLIEVPLAKSLLFRTRTEKNNPEGRSLLRNAYRPWYFSKKIEEIEAIGIERDLAGLPMITPPENVDIWNPKDSLALAKKTAAEKLVRSIRRDEQEGIVKPFGWEFSLLSTGGRRQLDITGIIARYDQRKAMVLLADFILLGHEKVGSFALSSSKTHLFSMALGGILDIIAEIVNREAIPQLLRLNGRPVHEKLAKLTHGDVESLSLAELGAYVTALSGAGIDLADEPTERELRAQAKLPMPPEEDEDEKDLEEEGAMEEIRENMRAMREEMDRRNGNNVPNQPPPGNPPPGNANNGS